MEPIKVFIAEDESIVREGLRDMIPWEQYGMQFVGDAPDGEVALPMIRRLKPDILITDIKMPFMDGITLSGFVSRESPDTKILILSGYSDFDYARQAIELKVDQYLLKPITKTAMVKALEQTIRAIETEREQKDYLRKYEQEFKKYERYSRRNFFEKLIEGSLSVADIYEQAEQLHLNLNAEGYNFVIFTVQDASETSYSKAASAVLEDVLDYFLRYPDFILFRGNVLSYAVLIKGDAGMLEERTKQCVDGIQRFCEASETPLHWYAAVGNPTDRLSGLPQCYADTSHVLAYRHLIPTEHIFSAELLHREKSALDPQNLDSLDVSNIDPLVLRNFVKTGVVEETESFVKDYIAMLSGAEASVLFQHYLIMSARINAELALREMEYDATSYLSRIPKAELNMPPAKLEEYLIDVLRTAIDVRDIESQKNNSGIVDDALRFINKNYSDVNISLNSVAKAINISSNYLSALFSQKMEISFVEYLTKRRMEKAKQLLRQTDKRSGEIAYEVGYKDPRYFSFVFRKTQGCTPSSYRTGEPDRE